jgi:UDP-N-acetylglucosamine/UDP-N-acetylgalactosamine diphosphorylase
MASASLDDLFYLCRGFRALSVVEHIGLRLREGLVLRSEATRSTHILQRLNYMNEELRQSLTSIGQEGVLRFFDQLNPSEQQQLEQQLADVDLELIVRLTNETEEICQWAELARRAAPPPAFRLNDSHAPFTFAQARQRGEAALRAGEVGVILVAGGQGTRLGFEHPKGMFPIGPVSRNSIFQILIERVVASSQRYGKPIPLFIMTSPATHDESVAFLNEQRFFGMDPRDVMVFCQGTMPAVDDRTGQLLLAAKSSLALSPDGHGGMLKALEKNGCLQKARERGIRQFSYGQIDNPLVQICHPELIGYHLLAESEMTSQVVEKTDPLDRVGNVVVVDGRMQIIEYSDLPDDVANRRDEDGSLSVWAGSIAVHVFDVNFLERASQQANVLPFHRAHKKVAYVNDQGDTIKPDQPNATKFERFIFDLLPEARNAIVVEGRRADVFAPLKNAEGAATDTATATREAMVRLHTHWLAESGVNVARGTPVEISPLWALDAGQVAQRCTPGQRITKPTYFRLRLFQDREGEATTEPDGS